jgi:hypothetical protein
MTDELVGVEKGSWLAVRWRSGAGWALPAATFLIYAAIVFALPQVGDNSYPCERSSIAAAVTNVVYGARLGTVYSGVLDQSLKAINAPVEQVMRDTPGLGDDRPAPPAGPLMETTQDGNGVGYLVVAAAAFRLFGVHAWALVLAMLTLMAASGALFLWRFSALAGVVSLYFTALTAMLFTPLISTPNYAINIPVAGIRYFSLLTALPAFHLLLDILDIPAARRGSAAPGEYAALAAQAAILAIALLVRGSMTAIVVAIVVVGLAVAWRRRGERRLLGCKALAIGLTVVMLLGAIVLAVPHNYMKEGRFGTVIWHRVTLSLGFDPAFPYPGVREMFPCEKYIPEGIQPGSEDRNGHCIWLAYVIEHNIPIETIGDKTYGGEYEVALREAFFKIVRQNPGRALLTFLYYKPMYIPWSIGESLGFDFSKYSRMAIGLLIAALAVMLVSIIAIGPSPSQLPRLAGVTLVCAGCALPPPLAVWALPYTSADLLLFCLLLAGLAVAAITQAALRALRRSREMFNSKI